MTCSLDDVLRTLRPDSDYARGALDVLRLLGLLAAPADQAAASGKVARMLLDVLRAHLADGISVDLDWDNLDGVPPRGVDVIRAIEQARLARVDRPTPARVVQAAQSIFKTRRGSGSEAQDFYLMQYDHHARRYQPVGGKRDSGDADLMVTLRREMAEELGLPAPPDDGHCTLEPVAEGWVETTLSATYGLLTQYTFAFYRIAEAHFPVKLTEDTRWLSRAEIAAEIAADGRPISSIYRQALGLAALDALPLTALD